MAQRAEIIQSIPRVAARPRVHGGGDPGAAPRAVGRAGHAVRHPSRRPRHRHVPAHRPRTAPEAVDRRRRRPGVRDRPGVPQRGGVAADTTPSSRCSSSYQALADYGDMADITEALVVEAAERVLGTTEITFDGRPMSLRAPWRRLDYVGSVSEATGNDWDPVMPVAEARTLAKSAGSQGRRGVGDRQDHRRGIPKRVEDTIWEPTFVLDFPEEISPLARKHRSRPGLTERFEVTVAGSELANAFSELNDPVEQRRRFEETQAAARDAGDHVAHPMDEDFLRALEYGMPPPAEWGMGIDRLVMLLTDQTSILEVVLLTSLFRRSSSTANRTRCRQMFRWDSSR